MTEDQLFICILFFIALYIAAIYGVLKGRKEEKPITQKWNLRSWKDD